MAIPGKRKAGMALLLCSTCWLVTAWLTYLGQRNEVADSDVADLELASDDGRLSSGHSPRGRITESADQGQPIAHRALATLERRGAFRISGVLRDTRRAPVSSVHLNLTVEWKGTVVAQRALTTNSRGEFSWHVPALPSGERVLVVISAESPERVAVLRARRAVVVVPGSTLHVAVLCSREMTTVTGRLLYYASARTVTGGYVQGQHGRLCRVDNSGRFEVRVPVWSGRALLYYGRKVGGQTIQEYFVRLKSPGLHRELDLYLTESLRWITVRATHEGNPVCGVRVVKQGSRISAHSDKNGCCRLPVEVGKECVLVSTHPDYVKQYWPVPGDCQIVNMELVRSVSLTGRVLLHNGQPATGAQVVISSDRMMLGDVGTATTGKDGTFRFQHSDVEGLNSLWLKATGRKGGVGTSFACIRKGQRRIQDLILRRRALLTGIVHGEDGESGTPLREALVTVVAVTGAGVDHGRAYTNAVGRFQIRVAGTGRYRLVCSRRGFVTEERVASAGHTMSIVMQRSGFVSGRVLEDGLPARSFRVRVGRLRGGGFVDMEPGSLFSGGVFVVPVHSLRIGQKCQVKVALHRHTEKSVDVTVEARKSYATTVVFNRRDAGK